MLRIIWGAVLIIAGVFMMFQAVDAQSTIDATEKYIVKLPAKQKEELTEGIVRQFSAGIVLGLVGSALVYFGQRSTRKPSLVRRSASFPAPKPGRGPQSLVTFDQPCDDSDDDPRAGWKI